MRRGIVLGVLLTVAARMAGRRFWGWYRVQHHATGEMKGRSYW